VQSVAARVIELQCITTESPLGSAAHRECVDTKRAALLSEQPVEPEPVQPVRPVQRVPGDDDLDAFIMGQTPPPAARTGGDPGDWLWVLYVGVGALPFVWTAWTRPRKPCRSCSKPTRGRDGICYDCERAAEQQARALHDAAKRQAEGRARADQARAEEERRRRESEGAARERSTAKTDSGFDPYAVLEIPRSADAAMIKSAYRRLVSQYHPDKVAHLGSELREVANRKTQEITKAYQMLS
jgi:DnaJ like chaperone protein